MTAHDAACPVQSGQLFSCDYCRALAKARSQERATAAETWQDNLPLVTERAAKDERAAIERRIRESGIARHLSSHQWDVLIATVRGRDA